MVDRGGVRARVLAVGSLAALVMAVLWTGLASALPDGRRYELVSPVQKSAADVLPNPQRTRAALTGGAVQYSSLTGFGDVRGGSYASDYIAVRGTDGVWRTHGIYPVQDPTSFSPDVSAGFEPRYMGEFSDDLAHGVFMAKTPLTNAPNVAHAINLYLRNDLLTPGAGAYQLLTNAITDQGSVYDPFPPAPPAIAGASTDFSHVIFESARSLLAETASLPADQFKLYEWVDGTIRLVGLVPTAPDEECGASGPACVPAVSQAGQGANTSSKAYTLTTISTDGRRIIFTVPDPNLFGQVREGQLYLRDDQATTNLSDDTTVHVNASERTTPDTPQNATFWAASADGTKVFFTTPEKLTDEDPNASNDLYRYDLSASAGSRLTRISIDTEPADNQGNDLANGHNVPGAIGASTDGDSVYFIVTGGQLIAGGSTTPPAGNAGADGDARIYYWHLGTLHEVGGINAGASSESQRILGSFGWGLLPKWGRVTPDGQHLAFVTQGTDQLLSHYGKPEYDHGNTCDGLTSGTPACLEVYVYDAAANNGNGDLQCASCNPTGMPAAGRAEFRVAFALGGSLDTAHLNHPLSDDGRYVFFSSSDQLVPADKNNVTDAYQYNTQTGQVSLLSSGTSNSGSFFMDASADGRDVFLATRSQLRSEDHDQSTDLYDARINGTIDPGPTTTNVCEAENCRLAAVPTATEQNPASLAFHGPGDRLAPRNPAAFFATQPLTRRKRRHLARTGSTRLEISASQAGTLTIRIRARINGHTRTIQTIHRKLKNAATIHPRVQLTAAARRQLADHHHLTLTITTTYNQAALPQVMRIKLNS